MKLNEKQLENLDKEFGKLKKDEKIISLSDVKKRIDQIIDLTEELEDLLSEQMDAIEIVSECDDDACGCEEVEQSELYELYSELEDRVLGGEFYRAIRMIS